MKKNVLIIESSLRNNSNSDLLAKAFCEGAIEAGNIVDIISLKEKRIAFCNGCGACQETSKSGKRIGECIIKDDAAAIVHKMYNTDVIVFASPVYYYSIPGQLKTLIDRANCLYDSDYHFTQAYFLCTATENKDTTPFGAITAIQGWADCFPRAKLVDTCFVGGVSNPGDILQPQFSGLLQKAKDMGSKI